MFLSNKWIGAIMSDSTTPIQDIFDTKNLHHGQKNFLKCLAAMPKAKQLYGDVVTELDIAIAKDAEYILSVKIMNDHEIDQLISTHGLNAFSFVQAKGKTPESLHGKVAFAINRWDYEWLTPKNNLVFRDRKYYDFKLVQP